MVGGGVEGCSASGSCFDFFFLPRAGQSKRGLWKKSLRRGKISGARLLV